MKSYEFITEAKPENLGQNKLDQLFATYEKRDSRDNTLPQKFDNGLEVTNYIFQFVGPNNLIWVTNQYIKDQYFFLHDLPQWKTTLEEFFKITRSSRIQVNKDVNSYSNISELRKALDIAKGRSEQLGSKFYSKSISTIDKFVNEGEAKWLYRSNDYSIYQPLTFESSNICKNFNISVSACTIMDEDNYADYVDTGTLIYIIDQTNIYICYISNDIEEYKSEFSDADNNHDYNLEWQLNKFPALRPIIEKINIDLNDWLLSISLAETDQEKYDIALRAVLEDGRELEYMPDEYKTPQICLAAVKQNGGALKYVPDEYKTPQMCLAAVKQNGLALQYVPEELKTREICLAAVKQNGLAVFKLPKEYKTPEFYLEAVKLNGYAMHHVPDELKTPKMCMIAVKQDGNSLKFVPNKYKTSELCLIAVKQNGWALQYVPDELKTQQMCLIAVKQHGYALEYVPDEYKTEQLCLVAVKQDGWAVHYVPKELKTPQMCLAAVKQNGLALQYVPEELKTREMCLAAVKQNGGALKYVPKELKDTVIKQLQNNDDVNESLTRIKELIGYKL